MGMLKNLLGQGIFKGLQPYEWEYRPCNMMGKSAKQFELIFKRDVNGTYCNFWMAEDKITSGPKHHHACALVRSPKEHVISQHFHCTESAVYQNRAHLMPPLDDWLDHHVKRLEAMNKTGRKSGDLFKCYDPINLQSFFTNFDENTNAPDLKKGLM